MEMRSRKAGKQGRIEASQDEEGEIPPMGRSKGETGGTKDRHGPPSDDDRTVEEALPSPLEVRKGRGNHPRDRYTPTMARRDMQP